MSTYTFTKKPLPPENHQSNYGGVQRDSSKQTFGLLGNGFQTTDRMGLRSPIDLKADKIVVLHTPLDAVSITIISKDADVLISEIEGFTSYSVCPPTSPQSFELGNQGSVYLHAPIPTSVSFNYKVI